MALADHYRVLGLRTGASFGDVKLAYRNLARLYHPDVNPGDQRSKEKFIQITQAYRTLAESLPQEVAWQKSHKPKPPMETAQQGGVGERDIDGAIGKENKETNDHGRDLTSQAPSKSAPVNPALRSVPGASPAEQQLKMVSFGKLRDLFQSNRFPRAVALVEGLANRFPNDAEVRQWHAITYYRWGHDLLKNGNTNKANACLKKALRLDPQNKSLQEAVQSDLRRVEQLLSIPVAQ
jgi:curved DNA-binding protein CbpA